jgi:LCP family protein required for cell wall assembly
VRIQAGEPLQILQSPVELAVHLPGRKGMVPLSASYRDGGVALTADIIRELVGLPEGEPERFVVVPRKALRSLVDGLGQVEVNLSQSFSHTDKSQNYRVNLQAGRQTLNGAQAEQLVRLRQDPLDEQARRIRQQWLVMGLAEQLRQPNAITLLPGLLGEISADVSSDLSSTEWLSLTAATLSSNQPPRISSLPLAPRAGKQILRQLNPSAPRPLWEPVNGQPAP